MLGKPATRFIKPIIDPNPHGLWGRKPRSLASFELKSTLFM